MTNFLALGCPTCSRTDRLEVAAHVWLRLTEDGTDPYLARNRDHEYHPASPAICVACGWAGTLAACKAEAAP